MSVLFVSRTILSFSRVVDSSKPHRGPLGDAFARSGQQLIPGAPSFAAIGCAGCPQAENGSVLARGSAADERVGAFGGTDCRHAKVYLNGAVDGTAA